MRARKRKWKTGTPASSVLKNSEVSKAFNSLAYYLAKRDHTEKELKTKMGRRHTAEAIAGAIEKAHDYGYMKDPAELEVRLAKHFGDKGRGHMKIQFELKKRGLPGAVAFDPDLELDKALRHVDKIHSVGDDLNAIKKVKIMRLLKNRGFIGETISAVFDFLKTGKR